MKRKLLTLLTVVLAVVFMINTVSAELVSKDWQFVDDGNITHDTVTNIEWLDISVTLGISTDEMLVELQPGGEFDGFRYATVADFNALNSALGMVSAVYFAPMENVNGIRTMHRLFGGVYYDWDPSGWHTYTVYGYTSTDQVRRRSYELKVHPSHPLVYKYVTVIGNSDFGEGIFQNNIIGHFIVKDSASEPPEPFDITIDIKPGGCPTPLNVTDEGDFPVAVLGTEYLDVTEIDPVSIKLEEVVAPLRSNTEDISMPLNVQMCKDEGLEEEYYDYGQFDGYDDLVLKFDNQEIVASLGLDNLNDGDVVELTLTATLVDGTEIVGSNFVLIIKN
ncbi:MAG: hypothetical protein U9R34_08525 [Nanoarchaeota archaeon]|nr:hypothetical protein [Nanoarchaeota archaeon]